MKIQTIYRSSRLGIVDKPKALDLVNGVYLFKLGTGYKYELIRGKKQFELTNHLGNVLATISDKKIPVSASGRTIDYYVADLVTATFYSSYGASVNGYNFEKQVNAFNGQRRSPEISSTAQTAQFWEYDSRIGRRWNVEPLIHKYPSNSSYLVFNNNPILFADADGKDIIVLRNSNGAHGTGHGAILVGDNKNGWTYISKDGYTGSAFGSKPKFVVMKFSSIEKFRNSPHNFETNETHSTADGKEAKGLTFKLDKDGNKIQRYDQALYIPTTRADGTSTDAKTIQNATNSAKSDYCLMNGDCSDVVADGLSGSKDNNGTPLKNGNSIPTGQAVIDLWNKRPNTKFNKTADRNKSDINYDTGVKPDDKTLQKGEIGTK